MFGMAAIKRFAISLNEQCSIPNFERDHAGSGPPLFETDEITVAAWYLRRIAAYPLRGCYAAPNAYSRTRRSHGDRVWRYHLGECNKGRSALVTSWLQSPLFKAGPAPDSHLISHQLSKIAAPADETNDHSAALPPKRYKRPCFISRLPTIPVKLSCMAC